MAQWVQYMLIYVSAFLFSSDDVASVDYNLPWTPSYLISIDNEISVCLGDKVNLTCPGSDSTVVYSNSESDYNGCTYDGKCDPNNPGDPYRFGDCTLNGMIILDVKSISLQFSCQVKFNSGQTSYFYSSYSSDCENGLKLKINVLTSAQCISPTNSSSVNPSNSGGKDNGKSWILGNSSTAISSGSQGGEETMNSSRSSAEKSVIKSSITTGRDNPPAASLVPSIGAVGPSGSSDSIYKVWKIGIIACGVITGIFTFM